MTSEERIAELQLVVAAQGRLIANLYAQLRDWIPENRPLSLSLEEGQSLLDDCLEGLPAEIQNRHFGELLDYYRHRRPLHDRP